MTESHRILVCGVGSAGERHIDNLLKLGHHRIALFRQRGLPLRTVPQHLPVYQHLQTAIDQFKPSVVFVANPTALHVAISLQAALAGCHLFIEKPVSHNLDRLGELQDVIKRNSRVAMVGYMLRFHPLLQQVKRWLDEGSLGRPLFARACWGEHLPDWHPWEDYRKSYAGSRKLGGGPALTLSHELDLLVWLFGRAERVVSISSANSPLEVDCEHIVDILIRFEKGVTGNVHLDYCQRPPHRSWELVCSEARIVFDYCQGTLTRWNGKIGETPQNGVVRTPVAEVLKVHDGFDRNEMFLNELRYFFDRIQKGQPCSPDIEEAAESVRIALLALEGDKRESPRIPA